MWPALWPSVAVVGLFATVSFFDVLPYLPGWAHSLALVAFAIAFLAALYRARLAFRLPDEAAGRRRLERASGMKHRPLTTLKDRISGGANDRAAEALWQAHRARVRAALKSVRAGWPQPGLPGRDPWALRAALLLVLVVGVGVAGRDAGNRLLRAVTPGSAVAAIPAGMLDLWITPPAYTGMAPLLPRAEPGAPAEIAVPTGSVLLAQVSGGTGTPKLTIDKEATAFTAIDNRSYRVSNTIAGGSKLIVEQDGKPLGSWAMKVIPDAAPKVEFGTAPSRTRRAALKLEYDASDDYGLASVSAVISRAERPEGVPDEQIDIALPLPGQRLKEAKGSSYHDLTAHPWAGLPIKITLKAADAAGQEGTSEEFATVLPERVFQHPVARAIVEQRRALVADPNQRTIVSRALAAIASDSVRTTMTTWWSISRSRPPRCGRCATPRRRGAMPCSTCCGIRRCASRMASCRWPSAICARSSSGYRTRSPTTRPTPRSRS